jgi:MGT family glycosyltransferase
LVYFTLGTIFNLESGDLFERVLAGIRDLPINLIATVGNEIDPSEFGPQPANIQITQYIPQAAILPHCTLAIVHGGSGSVMGALAYGVPMVIIPLGADQPHNADRCADLGVAQVLDAIEATSADIRAAVLAVLNSPHFRQNAERLRAEIASLPGTSYALGLIEQLASERQPVLAT